MSVWQEHEPNCDCWFFRQGVLAENVDFFDPRSKMLNNPEFASQMIDYLDSAILERVDPCDGRPGQISIPSTWTLRMIENMCMATEML